MKQLSIASLAAVLLLPFFAVVVRVKGQDRFFFEHESDWNEGIMSPSDWGQVECDDIATCPGWPTRWQALSKFIPDNLTNTCYDCTTRIRKECQHHQQSPIDLWRNATANRDCFDRHRMHHKRGTCRFEDLRFEILPHVLRANQPALPCPHRPVIDFSWGFPAPWLLTHTDIAVPSLHRQDGRQYDGEVIMSHVYSNNKEDKRIGNVACFLEMGTEDDRYDFLDLYLHRWQEEHQRILDDCGNGAARRRTKAKDESKSTEPRALATSNVTYQELDFPYYQGVFNPYDWYINARTHYYFRYEGSTTEPPCIEKTHWRVLKDPIPVAPSQIAEIQDLLVNRVDPSTCQPYTAARVESDGSVHVNRPLQRKRPSHKLVFCECIDWESKGALDRQYCKLSPEERGVIPRTERPTAPTTMRPSTAPTQAPDMCQCPSEKSRYLCELFQLIRPDETPICP